MHSKELITVIIPVYNAEKYMAEAIESVFEQTLQPFEIIVVNDGSTDKSASIVEKYAPKVAIINQENRGISGARNTGIRSSGGSMIAFLDADDIWTEDHLEKLFAPFEENDDLGITAGYVEQFLNDGENGASQIIPKEKKVMPGNVAGASLIKKMVFEKVGLFDEKLTLAEYIDWFSRVKDYGVSTRLIKDVVLKRRIHSDNIGIREKAHINDYTKVLMASIRRKRKNERKE